MTDTPTIAITGPTSGIGLAAARALAAGGARVLLLARDVQKGEQLRDALARATGDPRRAEVFHCDLASFASVRAAAAGLLARHPRLDALVNNAGVYARTRQQTEDGHELTWQVNHLAHFLLAHLLHPALARPAGARLVVVSSGAHVAAWRGLRFGDLDLVRGWGPFTAYAHAKLAEVSFTLAAARRWAGDGITCNAVHPGHVDTALYAGEASLAERVQRALVTFRTPEQGADTAVWLASAPEAAGLTGGYFHDRRAVRPSRRALDVEAQDRLWRESALATGV